MVHRVAIFAASLVAAVALFVGLVVAGFAPAAPFGAQPASVPAAATESPAPVVQVDTVYVAPQPTPQDVVVTQTVPAAGGENEGSDD